MICVAETDINHSNNTEIFVGKDILELLSSSMYVNPLVIYREYIQNASDAIDDAAESGLLSCINEGKIEISLDHINRRALIRDNGIGIPNNHFLSRMLSFGASTKRGTDARGFRGVGRLAGLGYVQSLVFRTRAVCDSDVMEVTWDMHTVKRILALPHCDIDIQTVVDEAVTFKQFSSNNHPSHFFEVELIRPRRIANDKLLNEVEIDSFIGQTCPCPFSPEFSHGPGIIESLIPYGRAAQVYKIFINGSPNPVYRPYRDEITYSDSKSGKINNCIEQITVESPDSDGFAALGWYVHHDYKGAIPISQGVRGLRARVGNIQTGSDRLFAEVFPEDRFNSWAIGEVHILDDRIVPNGRRDAFESSVYLDHLISHLRIVGSKIARQCRISSQKRHRQRSFELGIDKINEILEIIRQGAISTHRIKSLRADVEDILSINSNIVAFEKFNEKESKELKKKLASIVAEVDTVNNRNTNDSFACLPTEKRAIYKEVFNLIYICSANQAVARKLVDRILNNLSRS